MLYKKGDIKRNPNRKEPRDRSTSQLTKEMQESAYSSTTSASSSSLGTFSEHDYSLNNDSLNQDLLDLREKVKSPRR